MRVFRILRDFSKKPYRNVFENYYKFLQRFYKKNWYGFSVFYKVFSKKSYKNIVGFSYFLVWVITKFKKNFKNFNTVFSMDSCKIDSLVPIFQANRLSMIRFRIDSRIDAFRRSEHPYYIVNIVTWKTVQYWKTNSSLLKKILCYLNTSDIKKNLCYIVNIATWKPIRYRKTNSSLLQKMLSYWKNSLLLKKIFLLLKKMLRC